jgi:thioredoxin 1
MPTILFFNKGEKITEVVGANPHAIEEGIKALVA